jgi:DNA polymerase epsilon subunit 2
LPHFQPTEDLFEPLEEAIPLLIFAQNPARLSFFGKEMLIFRENVLRDLKRGSVTLTTEDLAAEKHLASTILSQSHLSPMSIYKKPVLSQVDHVMSLYRTPDLLIVADDNCNEFELTLGEHPDHRTLIVNPGSFSKNFAFSVITPLLGLNEPSKLSE